MTATGHFSPLSLSLVLAAYALVLAAVGHWSEVRARRHGYLATDKAWVYALALTVYCTSWTYFGSTGSAANSGMLFSTIYIGPTLTMLLAWSLVRRLIRLQRRYHFTSIVDLVTQRYGQSLTMAAFITLVWLLGVIPYVGLQLRAMVTSFTLLTGLEHSAATLRQGHYTDEMMIVAIGLLTCFFGLRRTDTRIRQHGLMAVLGVEAIVKLAAFLAVGIFVTWGLFAGPGDIVRQVELNLQLSQHFEALSRGTNYLTWMSYLLLSMAAIVFLPRMFHVMVVENRDERHLLQAMWILPLYLLLISLFVLPIAAAGLLLGHAPEMADWFVVLLPFRNDAAALTLLAYLGGVSAAVGMIMVSCTAVVIMVSNHIAVPLIDRWLPGRHIGGKLRLIRWAVVFLLLWGAYHFQKGLPNTYLLIQMGLISFVAVLQFVPAVLGALYWERGSRTGAWWGLSLGWAVWAYTLFLPAVVRSLMGDVQWLASGPWGIAWLRPDNLLELGQQSAIFNAVFWSMLANLGGYFLGSILRPPRQEEFDAAHVYYMAGSDRQEASADEQAEADIDFAMVKSQVEQLFQRFLPHDESAAAIERAMQHARPDTRGQLTCSGYMQLSDAVEATLSGVVGAAMARKAVADALQLRPEQAESLKSTLVAELARLRISPQQLREQADYFRRLSETGQQHAQELENLVARRTAELRESLQSLQDSEQTIRAVTDTAQDAVVILDAAGRVSFWNPAAERMFGWTTQEVLDHPLEAFIIPAPLREAHRAAYQRFQHGGAAKRVGSTVELVAVARDGREIPIELSLSAATLRGSKHAIGILRDVTERKRSTDEMQRNIEALRQLNQRLEETQSQLLQSEKMASIGQLAAGVAHEINNPVGFVNSNLGTLKTYTEQMLELLGHYRRAEEQIADPALREAIARQREALDLDYLADDLPALLRESAEGLVRVKKIVQDLKDFSHVDESEWQFADLNAGLESTLNVVWNEVKYKASVVKNYATLPPVQCLASQLNQVFMNMIVNAVHALDPARGMGTLTLATGSRGDEVWVEVRDTGRGMGEDVKRRIFEPFFTTKPVGKGTGLGLSLSYNIIQKHHGRIEVESTPDVGTVFRIWIPVQQPAVAEEAGGA